MPGITADELSRKYGVPEMWPVSSECMASAQPTVLSLDPKQM